MEEKIENKDYKIDTSSLLPKFEEVIQSFKSGDEKVVTDAVIKLLTATPKEIIQEAESQIKEKDSLRRFVQHTELLNSCISESSFINNTATFEEATGLAYKLYLHCLDIWHDSLIMFKNGLFAAATFFAIVCIEESAKVTVLSFSILRNQADKEAEPKTFKQKKDTKKGKDPLLKHPLKHLLAGMSGLLVNSRADRKVGRAKILDFLQMIEQQKLESFRQSCLYADSRNNKIILPRDCHSAETSAHYISLAGEIIAESFFMQHDSPFWKELDEFETQFLLKK